MNLDSIKFIQIEIGYLEAMVFTSAPHFTFVIHHPLMFSVLNVCPSVHVCVFRVCARLHRKGEIVRECGRACAFLYVTATM